MLQEGDSLRVAVLVGASIVLGLARATLLPGGIALVGAAPADDAASCSAPHLQVDAHATAGEASEMVSRIDVETALSLAGQPGVVFIDARPREAWARAHVPGALNVPPGSQRDAALESSLSAHGVRTDDTVIVYCDSPDCSLSEPLARALRDRGVCSEPATLNGGLTAWIAADGPIDSAEVPPAPVTMSGDPR